VSEPRTRERPGEDHRSGTRDTSRDCDESAADGAFTAARGGRFFFA
jgi:hypothetical protein